MSTALSPRQIADLAADYPHVSDITLAARYGLTVDDVGAVAGRLGLTKQPNVNRVRHQTAEQLADARRPAVTRLRFPGQPGGDYCPSCGQIHHHWPGCRLYGTDDRPLLPTGDPA